MKLGKARDVDIRQINWCSSNLDKFPNCQQNAYQKHLGSLTSFSPQGAINHNLESNMNVYAAILDTAGAFDYVKHNALFVK